MKQIIWIIFASLCIAIGFYPLTYFLIDEQFGLLSTKPIELLTNAIWRLGFYSHIIFSGVALLVGWSQFSKKWRTERLDLHRLIGKIYVLSMLLGASSGIFIGINATGGLVSQAGFISLGVIGFTTTLLAFMAIKKRDILRHQQWMIFSYASCFAAVNLRLFLPLLVMAHKGEFEPAYRIVAWLCWVPNLVVAWWMVRRLEPAY